MQLDETRREATLVLSPQGRLDAHSTPAFHDRLLGYIDAGERSVLLDLSRLDYIGSAGLRTLLSASKRLNELGGRFGLSAPTAHVAEVLRISGFDTVVDIYPDAATALAALG